MLDHPKKTNVYLEKIDQERIEKIKVSIGAKNDAAAIRFAIRNVKIK